MITETALTNMILREAHRFVGLKEIKPNARWDNPKTPGVDTELCAELRGMMKPAPWQEGWAYCAAYTEGIVVTALRRLGATEAQIWRFANVHTPHVMTNVRAFRKLNLLVSIPSPGALWMARHGSTDRGHEGIVVSAEKARMATVEANTSLDPSSPEREREGDWITNRVRHIHSNGALMTQGFLPVSAIVRLVA